MDNMMIIIGFFFFLCEVLNIVMIYREKNFFLYIYEECFLRIKGIYMYIVNLFKLDIIEIVII